MNEFITVYSAELVRRLRSRPFLIGLVVGTLAILFMIRSPQFLGNTFTGSKTTVLLGDAELTDRAADLLAGDFTVAARLPKQRPTGKMLTENNASSIIVLDVRNKRLALTVYAKDPASVQQDRLRSRLLPLQVQVRTGRSAPSVTNELAIPIDVHPVGSKFASSEQAEAAHAIAYLLLFFLYVLVLLNSQLVMSSVAEEKTTRIAELLVASVDPIALLAGKIAAAATLALGQLALWVVVAAYAGGGMTSNSPAAGAGIDFSGISTALSPLVVVFFLLFFVVGLLQIATLFAGFASLINRTEDLGSLQGPLILPVVAAFFIAMAALGSPDTPWVRALSVVPIVSPFVMFARMAVSNVPIWQTTFALVINVAALGVIMIFAGKLYRIGMLLYGRPPKFSQILSVLRNG